MSALLLVPLPPVLLALMLAVRGPVRDVAIRLAPWAALPALIVALTTPPAAEPLRVPWLLLGAQIGFDELGRGFLLFTALVWTAAGIFAQTWLRDNPRRLRYFALHLLTLAGNLSLPIAADAVVFYLGFALMTFAAYGLVVFDDSAAARRAGHVYIVMAVLAEGALLGGLLLASGASEGALGFSEMTSAIAASPHRGLIVGLLLAGFAVKAGALPLHLWLPLAHPVAPTAASAVLSGCMIKAGLLGWLRFLPLGEAALPDWGAGLIVAGLAATFLGVIAGTAQDDAKTTLAYSSISQMGFMSVAVGIGLADVAAAPVAVATCAVYAAHHGLAKGALFLGVGVAHDTGSRHARTGVLAALAIPALALAGAPLTSGTIAKGYLKSIESFAPPLPVPLHALLLAAAAGTTVVLARFLWLVRGMHADTRARPRAGYWLPWAVLIAGVAALGIAGPRPFTSIDPPAPPLYLGDLAGSAGPVIAGLLLAWLGVRARLSLRIPPGDLLLPIERVLRRLARGRGAAGVPVPAEPIAPLASRWYGFYAASRPTDRLLRLEIALTRWEVAGLLLLVLVTALYVTIRLGSA